MVVYHRVYHPWIMVVITIKEVELPLRADHPEHLPANSMENSMHSSMTRVLVALLLLALRLGLCPLL